MSARVAMLRMHEDGLIQLPPAQREKPDTTVRITARTDPQMTVTTPGPSLAPLDLYCLKKGDSRSGLWNEHIQRYHYLGQELLNHPEIGELFLAPLKSQGVLAMEDSAMIMRIKFTTKPGKQFIVRRYVLDEIRKLFDANGIRFASREVTVRLTDNSANHSEAEKQAAAAAAARSILEQEDNKTSAPGDVR